MRRHMHWVLLLVSVPVAYVSLMLVAQIISTAAAGADPGVTVGWSLGRLVIVLAAVVVPIVLLVRVFVQMRRTYRRAQRRKGKYSKLEQAALDAGSRRTAAWERARSVRTTLLGREVPAGIQQWDVVPHPDEAFFALAHLTYARYYGRDVTYTSSGMVATGSPGFVVGAIAAGALINASRRSGAAREAAPQWREWQLSRVYLTNRRIVVEAGGHWLSFDYGAMTAVFPEVASATLVCQFAGAEPMLLSGDDAALASVFAVLQTYGRDALRDHPALQVLNAPLELPPLPEVGRLG